MIKLNVDEEILGNYYYQVTLLEHFFEFVLRNDMDGILINPGTDNYIIGREVILEAYGGLPFDDPELKNASDYAFRL